MFPFDDVIMKTHIFQCINDDGNQCIGEHRHWGYKIDGHVAHSAPLIGLSGLLQMYLTQHDGQKFLYKGIQMKMSLTADGYIWQWIITKQDTGKR